MIHTTQECQIGDNVELMREMESDSIDTIVTSPPYWGLRNYNVGGQIGLEPTLDEYHARLLEVTAECMRVLKKTGMMFWNHGDSYGSNKSLNMQNSRLIIKMLDEQGWILRNDNIWYKPNGMPSSVTDRFSNKYEPVYMLVKSKPRSNDIKTFIEPPIPSDWRSWLAAIIDGEGTIGIRRSKMKDKHDTFGAYITVSNTNEQIVKRCMELTGLGTIRNHPGTNFKMYRWEVTHQQAISVIGEIYQYLIDKKEQAKVAIALQKTNVHRGNNKNTNRGPAPISEKEYKLKESLWELIKNLNQKEIGDSGFPEPNLDRCGGCEDYWFDLDAVRVPFKDASEVQYRKKLRANKEYDVKAPYKTNTPYKHNTARITSQESPNRMWDDAESLERQIAAGKNPGDVWTIPTQPYPESHFATFPTALIEPMIKAACPAEICPVCGMARERITKKEVEFTSGSGKSGNVPEGKYGGSEQATSGTYDIRMGPQVIRHTTGWTSCNCGAGWVAGTVLDPFAGSGTVGEVARKLNRNAILLELNPEYERLISKRIMKDTPPLTAYFGDD